MFSNPLVPRQPEKKKRNLFLMDRYWPFGSGPGEPGLIGLFTSACRPTRLEMPEPEILQFMRGFDIAKTQPEA
jgi:hypothetical protein